MWKFNLFLLMHVLGFLVSAKKLITPLRSDLEKSRLSIIRHVPLFF